MINFMKKKKKTKTGENNSFLEQDREGNFRQVNQ